MRKAKAEVKCKLNLEITFSNGRTKKLEMSKPQITVGRGSKVDVQVKDEGVSRNHLLIEMQGDKVTLTDQGSANGTFVGDDKLEAKTPFNFDTFFLPIRLGKNVTMVLTLQEII